MYLGKLEDHKTRAAHATQIKNCITDECQNDSGCAGWPERGGVSLERMDSAPYPVLIKEK